MGSDHAQKWNQYSAPEMAGHLVRRVMQKHNLDTLFVMTNAGTPEHRDALVKAMKPVKVVYMTPESGAYTELADLNFNQFLECLISTHGLLVFSPRCFLFHACMCTIALVFVGDSENFERASGLTKRTIDERRLYLNNIYPVCRYSAEWLVYICTVYTTV